MAAASPYLTERDELINRLVNKFPYSRQWFEQQSNSKLRAMLYRANNPAREMRGPVRVTITEKVENGEILHLTEAGIWEPEE